MYCIYNTALTGIIDNDSYQRTNSQIYINGILTPENIDDYIPMEKLCVDLIGTYFQNREERSKYILKLITITNAFAGWFELTHTFNGVIVITIKDLDICY